MDTADVARAIRTATSIAASLGLPADDVTVLHNSNKLALRLSPGDVVARVTRSEEEARVEVERARRLARTGCPVAVPDPRVEPLVHVHAGFAVTLWTYHAPVTPTVPPADYAEALVRLHAGMRGSDLASPRFTDRIAEAEEVAADPGLSPELTDVDRELLGSRLRVVRQRIADRGAVEQLLHGEPHPGNLLSTSGGPLFVDFETICRGPVEFDLAHVPAAVCAHYPGIDHDLLDACRQLVLAMVAAWRWQLGDEFPDRERWGHRLLHALREGPPWPTLDDLTRRSDVPTGAPTGAPTDHR